MATAKSIAPIDLSPTTCSRFPHHAQPAAPALARFGAADLRPFPGGFDAGLPDLPLLWPPSCGRLVALARWLGLGLAALSVWRARPSDQLLALARHDDATHLLDRFDSRLAPPGRLLDREGDWGLRALPPP